MPILDEMDFAADGLQVRYCGSETLQLLDIHARTTREAEHAFGPMLVRSLVQSIEAGAAGGAQYAPRSGHARILSAVEGSGPDFHWQLEIAGVCARFLRVATERLRLCGGWENPLLALEITGSHWDPTSLDRTDTPILQTWLEDPSAYPEVWPRLGFECDVSLRNIVGAELVLKTVSPVSLEQGNALEALCYQWLTTTLDYVDEAGAPIVDDPARQERLMPRCSWGGTEFCAAIEEYARDGAISAAVLLNSLERYHQEVAPLLRADIRL